MTNRGWNAKRRVWRRISNSTLSAACEIHTVAPKLGPASLGGSLQNPRLRQRMRAARQSTTLGSRGPFPRPKCIDRDPHLATPDAAPSRAFVCCAPWAINPIAHATSVAQVPRLEPFRACRSAFQKLRLGSSWCSRPHPAAGRPWGFPGPASCRSRARPQT